MESSLRLYIGYVPGWTVLLAGAALTLFGALSFFRTQLVVDIFLFASGIFLFVAGVISILIAAVLAIHRAAWLPPLIIGLLLIGIALLIIIIPGFLITFVIFLLAAVAALIGAIVLLVGATMSGRLRDRMVLFLIGMTTLICGIYLLLFPAASALILVKLAGIYGMMLGMLIMLGGLSLRGRFCRHPPEV
jgi:uncharacterized membrane protein HdeD (DUF308 family)